MSSVTSEPWFVGVDYHHKVLQICVMDSNGRIIRNVRGRNDWRVVRNVIETKGGVSIAIESCCGAASLAHELSEKGHYSVSLAHPGFVRRMKQNPDKTDYSDAQLLADLLRVGYLPKVWLAPNEIRELRQLVRYRQQLVNDRRDVKLRVRALLREWRIRAPEGKSWSRTWQKKVRSVKGLGADSQWILGQQLDRVEQLTAHIAVVEQYIAERVKNDAVVQKLMRQPGIGLITAVTMRSEIGHFDRFRSGKQLCRYAGVTPRNASSGERQADAGLIRAGNPYLRTVLIEAAHRLGRCHPRWRAFRERLLKKGKKPSVIAAAVANRWLRRLYHQMLPGALAA